METRIWTKIWENTAGVLVLRGPEISLLTVTLNMLGRMQPLEEAIQSLASGTPPGKIKTTMTETLDARTITKGVVEPGNDAFTLHAEGDGGKRKTLTFNTDGKDAEAILEVILAESERAFQPKSVKLSAVEALLGPVILGGLAGLVWMVVYHYAKQIAAGQQVGLEPGVTKYERSMISLAEWLGLTGTIGAGVVIVIIAVGSAVRELLRRKERTIWFLNSDESPERNAPAKP